MGGHAIVQGHVGITQVFTGLAQSAQNGRIVRPDNDKLEAVVRDAIPIGCPQRAVKGQALKAPTPASALRRGATQ